MAVTIELEPEALVLALTGWDTVWCLAREIRVPWSDVATARVLPVATVKEQLGLRVGGTYWPGRIATGHFLLRGQPGARQFWCVRRATDVLVIDTTLDRPRRLVVESPSAGALASTITAWLP